MEKSVREEKKKTPILKRPWADIFVLFEFLWKRLKEGGRLEMESTAVETEGKWGLNRTKAVMGPTLWATVLGMFYFIVSSLSIMF